MDVASGDEYKTKLVLRANSKVCGELLIPHDGFYAFTITRKRTNDVFAINITNYGETMERIGFYERKRNAKTKEYFLEKGNRYEKLY